MGNTVRGVDFCKHFVNKTNHKYHIFNNFDSVSTVDTQNKTVLLQHLIQSASNGDIESIKDLQGKIDFNECDYDGRTALHLAAAEGRYEVVDYLVSHSNVNVNVKDRWGNTPSHEVNKILSESNNERNREYYLKITNLLTIFEKKNNF